MDTKQICIDWDYGRAAIRKPKLQEACDLIVSLCLEIDKLQKEVDYQCNRQNLKEQHYGSMIIELQNVIRKYM